MNTVAHFLSQHRRHRSGVFKSAHFYFVFVTEWSRLVVVLIYTCGHHYDWLTSFQLNKDIFM